MLSRSILVPSSFRNFLVHSTIRSLAASTVEQGLAFENNVIQVFSKLGMTLHYAGGPNDRGIDIQGLWKLDSYSIPVIIQCKSTKQSKPQYIREFVGVIGREYTNRGIDLKQLPPGDPSAPIGIFCTTSKIQNSMLRESALCSYPLLLARIGASSVLSLQPNYSLLRVYPDLRFVYDIDQTDIPTILFHDKVILGYS